MTIACPSLARPEGGKGFAATGVGEGEGAAGPECPGCPWPLARVGRECHIAARCDGAASGAD
jgi:hypothetical protein